MLDRKANDLKERDEALNRSRTSRKRCFKLGLRRYKRRDVNNKTQDTQ